ncbi:MAG: DNA/RNA non-specific endonuclease [Cyanobacteria bacterium J06621_8]
MVLKIRLTVICLVILSLNCLPVSAQAVNPEKHYPYGIPLGSPSSNDLIVREIYALSSNDDTKFADWVAYRLDRNTVNGNASTSRTYRADPLINPDETLEPDDYDGANARIQTTRGHQAPLGTFKGTDFWSQTNYLSNLTPQKGDLNGGVWLDLERRVRGIVNQCDVVYVMTGTLYERDMPQLPQADEPHTIPSGYWKIVALNVEKEPSDLLVSAFIYDQDTPKRVSIESGQASVDEVEARSGLDFFSKLPDEIENRIEQEKTYVLNASLRRNNKCEIGSAAEGGATGELIVNADSTVKIVELLPNPVGDESQLESVTIQNVSNQTVDLTGWSLKDKANKSWSLDSIGSLSPGQDIKILRAGQAMALNNGGDTIELLNSEGLMIDRVKYGRTAEGVPVKISIFD